MNRMRSQNVLKNDMPPIQKLDLTDEQLTSYLSDLFSRASRVAIRIKDSAQASQRPLSRLSELHVALLNKHIWGAEVTYDYDGEQWIDTLVVNQQTTRLSRQQQAAILSA